LLKKLKYILDIGSSCLRLYAVTHFNRKSSLIAEEKVLYDGYMDGEFLSVDTLKDNIAELLSKMSEKIRKPIKSLIVGVPSEFSMTICKRISRKYLNLHKLTNDDIMDLYLSNIDGDSEEYEVINFSAMQFVLDDDYRTLEPVGKKTRNLILDASYVLAKKEFLKLIQEKVQELDIANVEFISTPLGQAMQCKKSYDEVKPFAVVDVGHITTSVAIFKGEGLALLSSFSMGGGHISADLMQILKVNFYDAELIKRKVILTLEPEKKDYYEVCSKGNLVKAPIGITNQVVKSRIEVIAKVIKDILSIDSIYDDIKVYLTGDGITNFKGVKSILQEVTNLEIKEFKNEFDLTNEKFQTSKSGLVTLMDEVI